MANTLDNVSITLLGNKFCNMMNFIGQNFVTLEGWWLELVLDFLRKIGRTLSRTSCKCICVISKTEEDYTKHFRVNLSICKLVVQYRPARTVHNGFNINLITNPLISVHTLRRRVCLIGVEHEIGAVGVVLGSEVVSVHTIIVIIGNPLLLSYRLNGSKNLTFKDFTLLAFVDLTLTVDLTLLIQTAFFKGHSVK